jgi:hypothetical protein
MPKASVVYLSGSHSGLGPESSRPQLITHYSRGCLSRSLVLRAKSSGPLCALNEMLLEAGMTTPCISPTLGCWSSPTASSSMTRRWCQSTDLDSYSSHCEFLVLPKQSLSPQIVILIPLCNIGVCF